MPVSDLRLLAIAGPPLVDPGHLLEACRRAVAGGVTAVQLRWKGAPARKLFRLAEALVRGLPVPVFVNDRADVALAAGAAGVHLGASDVPPRAVRAFAPRPFRIGVSAGSPAEADDAARADVDYWSIGSVYATTTKPDAGAPIGPAGFRALAALAPPGMPLIAIGGITALNAGEILAAGALGVAVSAAVFGTGDVERAARAVRDVADRAPAG